MLSQIIDKDKHCDKFSKRKTSLYPFPKRILNAVITKWRNLTSLFKEVFTNFKYLRNFHPDKISN